MRVFISADLEGVTGVTHPQDVIPGRPQYERFRRLLTVDVNAAIEILSEPVERLVLNLKAGKISVTFGDVLRMRQLPPAFGPTLDLRADDLDGRHPI